MRDYLTKHMTTVLASAVLFLASPLSVQADVFSDDALIGAALVGGGIGSGHLDYLDDDDDTPPSTKTIELGLTQAEETQLETWLGQGAISLTNIWSETTGSDNATAASWHTAMDSAGPTFSIYYITDMNDNDHKIGAYVTDSWGVEGVLSDSEAFVFSLTSDFKTNSSSYEFNLTSGSEEFATFDYKPVAFEILGFGGGDNVLGNLSGDLSSIYTVNGLETYTYTLTSVPVITSTVPEPSVIALMGLGLGMVGFISLRRKKSEAVA